ncbi:hypothetical protein Tdes44962_MAKER02209 [Teratosphaeria destructans]|uniref:Uncharacterized protein n=1 Tax=Teratosphaeria destructans TaxID=418781 RepID=A0A9W7SUW5_9PEZI|nr:hypothetical protein Tdes44962_MAKER02209 [Teratosphaeria destructans]
MYSTKLRRYHPSVPSAASALIRPLQPGHPVSFFKVSSPCCHPDSVEYGGAVNSFLGDSRDGAGHPETSLQRNAKA